MARVSEHTVAERTLPARALTEPALSEHGISERAAQPNIQDLFLNHARRERITVTIHLMTGRAFDARIKSFDRFAVVVDVNGADQLVFKHAIATIESPRSVADYFTAHS